MKFECNLHKPLWGTEEWVCSAHRSSPSVIADGEHKGKTLDQIYPDFPLLMKVIDAKTRLSVQVHPNEKTCLVTGGSPKSEMWCALSDGPIFAGLKDGTTPSMVKDAVLSGAFKELLVCHNAKKGDVFYIPGGLVHAIGDGVRLYEVQQSSDTTFRLYDWGRKGADGKERPLHVEQALAALDFSLPVPKPCQTLETPYFTFTQEDVSGERVFVAPNDAFLSVFGETTGQILLAPGEEFAVSVENEHFMVTQFK